MAQPSIVIDATIGGVSTNSILTLAETEELIHQHPFHDQWDTISDDDIKHAAMIWATRIMNHYGWKGVIASQTQALSWPRTEVYDKDNREYASDSYPEWLRVATAELTFFIAIEDRLTDTGTEGFKKIKIGPIDLEIDKYDRPDWIPNYILRAISPWFDEVPYLRTYRA